MSTVEAISIKVENSSALIIGTEWDDYGHAYNRDIRNRMNKDRAILNDIRAILVPTHIKLTN